VGLQRLDLHKMLCVVTCCCCGALLFAQVPSLQFLFCGQIKILISSGFAFFRFPGLPPKIFSQIENIQSNPPFPPFHVSHEIAGCNTKSAPTTTPLHTSYLKILVTSDHPLFLVLYDLLNHNHVICDIKTYKLDIK